MGTTHEALVLASSLSAIMILLVMWLQLIQRWKTWGEFFTYKGFTGSESPKLDSDNTKLKTFFQLFAEHWKQPIGRYRPVTAHTYFEVEFRTSRWVGFMYSRSWLAIVHAKIVAVIRDVFDPSGETGIVYYVEDDKC